MNDTLRVGFVADVSIDKVIGGAERVLHEQSTRMASRGHRVEVLTRRSPVHVRNHDTVQGVAEWRYEVNRRNPMLFLCSSMINSRRLFERRMKQVDFDCLNFHQPFSAFGCLRSPLLQNTFTFYTCHSLAFEEFGTRHSIPNHPLNRFLYRLEILFRKRLERSAILKSDKIVTLSQFTRQKLERQYGVAGDKIYVIPGGVDLEKFSPARLSDMIRSRYGYPPDKYLLLTVRNLVPRMGLEKLILAMKQIVAETNNVHLVIGGEGPLRMTLNAIVKRLNLESDISFAGFIPEESLPDYYRMADVFVLPTRNLEGFGLVTLEALACGVPVLGTPVGGTKEILGALDPELLFKDASAEEMFKKIADSYRAWVSDPQSWKQYKLRCRRFVEENYSWQQNVDQLETLIEDHRIRA